MVWFYYYNYWLRRLSHPLSNKRKYVAGSQGGWCIPVVSSTWKMMQEDHEFKSSFRYTNKFKVSLSYKRPYLKTK